MQYCIIGLDGLIKHIDEINELYKNVKNDFIILENKCSKNYLTKRLDNFGFDRMKCYSLIDESDENLINYFMLTYLSCESYKIFTSNMITQLQFSARGSAIKTYVEFNDESLTYNYILIPKDFKQPTNLKNSKNGCLGLDIPYLVLDDVNITFDNGNSTTYSVYRTVFKTKGLLDVWFCE
jgi:hypothetical protein